MKLEHLLLNLVLLNVFLFFQIQDWSAAVFWGWHPLVLGHF